MDNNELGYKIDQLARDIDRITERLNELATSNIIRDHKLKT